MFPKIENWDDFVVRVSWICSLILAAIAQEDPHTHLISVDEKTGIQALERIALDQPMEKGKPRRVEYEYTRHGTTCLMAGIDLGRGKIINHRLHPTRTEEDFLVFIQQTVEKIPKGEQIIFLADQLNTHKSESLVIWIAQEIDFKQDLGIKGKKGILKSMKTRKNFLENTEHRIRFAFTPKHCSWLNPIENWFAKLQRHIIKYGNFSSIIMLENKIEGYIHFYNRYLCKPLKWKFKGFIKAQKIKYKNYE